MSEPVKKVEARPIRHVEPVAPVRAREAVSVPDVRSAVDAFATGRADVVGAVRLAHLQRHVGNTALQRARGDGGRSPVLDVVRGGGGGPLPSGVRAEMEQRLGADFADVRIHTDGAAAASAAAVGAHAYTVGRDVVFGAGQFDPVSSTGRTMLAHELTHVVQQRSGPVAGTPTDGGISVSDPGDRFEREAVANAERVMRMPVPGAAVQERSPMRRPSPSVATVAQRDAASQAALTRLATPMVLPGPAPAVQGRLAQQLTAAMDANPAGIGPAVLQFGSAMFIGAIELDDVTGPLQNLIAGSVLKNLASRMPGSPVGESHALATNANGYALVTAQGLQQDVITLTLQTMHDAGQLDYLRNRGFVGDGWKILVEVHFYRSRPQASHNFHKDTLGQTLFVNLNYETAQPIAGPEYILNPPADPHHDRAVRRMLPRRFRGDLAATRANLPAPTTVQAPDIPAGGAVAFVDEAVHHMTPLRGHRPVTAAGLRAYLERTRPRRTARVLAAVTTFEAQGGSLLQHVRAALGPGTDDATAKRWTRRVQIMTSGAVVDRPQLRAVGLTAAEIDDLLAATHPGFRSVNVPDSPVVPLRALNRQMSSKAMRGTLPPPVAGDRQFFRTWVRAVRA